MRKSVFILFCCAILLAACAEARAQAVVRAECRISFVFDNSGLAGIRESWRFDPRFSAEVLREYDLDRDAKLSPSEVHTVKLGAFDNLRKSSYFNAIRINGTPYPVREVSDFDARIENGILTYEFFIPCHVPAASAERQVEVAVYDRDFYADISLAQDGMRIENAGGVAASFTVDFAKDLEFFGGAVAPEVVTLFFCRK